MTYDAKRIARQLEERVASDPASGLREVAMAAGVSRRTIQRVCRRVLGSPFSDWRREVVLARALDSLAASAGHGLEGAASAAGFGSARALTRFLKRETGLTPADVREWNRQPNAGPAIARDADPDPHR